MPAQVASRKKKFATMHVEVNYPPRKSEAPLVIRQETTVLRQVQSLW